jgi:hypothetical protein
MRITNSGRPVGEFPLFRLRDGEGRWFLALSCVDVSDVRNQPRAEPHYIALVKIDDRDGMKTVQIGHLYLFIAPRKVQLYVERHHQIEEE